MGKDSGRIDAESLKVILALINQVDVNILTDQERIRLLRIIAAIVAKILEIDIQIII